MLIKRIIKESLLNEVGTATAEPYRWRLTKASEDYVSYKFKTSGGSNLIIEVNFQLTKPFQFEKMGVIEMVEHPYYYWDTEFSVMKYKDREFWGDERSMTISASQYKSNKSEIFRIMSTLSAIVKDFIVIRKVRGFVFRPATDSRGKLFIKYFEKQLPNSNITKFEDGGILITIDNSIKYVKGEDPIYDESTYDFDLPKSKLNSGESWVYNDKTGQYERSGLIYKTRRKLDVK